MRTRYELIFAGSCNNDSNNNNKRKRQKQNEKKNKKHTVLLQGFLHALPFLLSLLFSCYQ